VTSVLTFRGSSESIPDDAIYWTLTCDGEDVVSGDGGSRTYRVAVAPGASCSVKMDSVVSTGWLGATWSGLGLVGITLPSGYSGSHKFTPGG